MSKQNSCNFDTRLAMLCCCCCCVKGQTRIYCLKQGQLSLKKNRCPSLKCTDIQMLGRRVYVPVVPGGAFNGNITFKHRAVLDRITDRLEGGDRAAAMSNVCLCWKAWAAITKYLRLKHKSVLFFQASLS